MVFALLRSRLSGRRWSAPAQALYGAVVAQARQPAYYIDYGVADSVDGRFDMICLIAALVIRRLQAEPASADGAALAQKVFDTMFADMDHNLREMGVGDLSVGTHVKTMAKAYYGRAAAYEAGLADGADPGILEAALRRNLYRLHEPASAQVGGMAAHVRAEAARLAGVPFAALCAGEAGFAAPPPLPPGRSAPPETVSPEVGP